MLKNEYIKEEDLKKMQQLILNIAKEIFKICKEEKISLYMLGGTFLGAIRHKGFIPWDDDMDFAIKRDEYNQFLTIIENKLPSNLKLMHYSVANDKNKINFHYIKIVDLNYVITEKIGEGKFEKRNIFIDIFPLDYIPNNFILKSKYKLNVFLKLQKMRLARLNAIYTDGKFSGDNIIKKMMFNFIEFTKISKKYNYYDTIVEFDNEIKKYDKYKNTSKISNILGGNGLFKETFSKKIFDNYNMYDFENTKLLGVKDYDTVLKQMYSDYMKLPKEQDRVCKHCLRIDKVN